MTRAAVARAARCAIPVALASTALVGTAAAAPPPVTAIDVDREDAPPGRAELGFDGGAPLGDYAFGVTTGLLDRPGVLAVGHRETLALGGGVAIGDAVALDLRLAGAHQTGLAPLAAWVLLDARLGLRIRVARGARVAVFLRGELTAPFGDERSYAGEAGTTGAWSVIGRAQLPHGVVIAASGGVYLRGREVALGDGARASDEVLGALGVVVPLPPLCHLWCRDQVLATAEVVGAAGDSDAHAHGPSPVEARLGVVSRPRPWLELAARAGAGLDDEIGAPRFRIAPSASWRHPSAARADTRGAAPAAPAASSASGDDTVDD